MDVQYEFDLISLSPVNYVRNDHEEINSGIADNEGQIYNETENLCISSNGHDFRIFFFFCDLQVEELFSNGKMNCLKKDIMLRWLLIYLRKI